jgi:molybdopterin converting factor small subunit
MKVVVKLHGILADVAGEKEFLLEGVQDLNELREIISCKYIAMSKYLFRIAVNDTITNENAKLKDGDQIHLIPPFPGG